MAGSFIPLLLLLTLLVAATSGGRVLLLPFYVIGHARQMMFMGEALAESGHEVYAAFNPNFNGLSHFKDGKVKILLHSSELEDLTTVPIERMIKITMDFTAKRDFVSSTRESLTEFGNLCVNQLMDDVHYNRLKQLNFDIAIVDIFPLSRCLLPIPYSLGIPYVGIETQYEPWLMGAPTLPSFVPSNTFVGVYTPSMNFWERLHNFWLHIDWFGFPGVSFLEDDFINKFIRDNKPYASMSQLFGGCSLFLTDVDAVLDYPRPQLPNEIAVGGLTTKPSKPLPKELQEFMEAATHGVIIVSFGSFTQDFGDDVLDELVSAFHQVKQMVIWKYQREPKGLSKNIKVLPWLPQNDLLGHPNTKMFMTHCGSNGQFEALYHAVPMIGYPLFADQPYNCKRIDYHGFGRCLDSTKFKASHLVSAINEIINNGSHKANIQLASHIFHDQLMSPIERVVYWVQHVMKFGGGHLRSHGLDMPWYQYWMVDILMFVLGVVSISLICWFLLFCLVVRYLTKSKQHVKHD